MRFFIIFGAMMISDAICKAHGVPPVVNEENRVILMAIVLFAFIADFVDLVKAK